MFSRCALVLAGAVVVGCTSPTLSNPPSSFVAVAAGSTAAPSEASNPPTIRASQGRVEIFGLIDTPDPCQVVTGTVTRTGADVDLRVSVQSAGQPCVLILGRFAYTAAIVALPAGMYTVAITHTYPNTGWPTTRVLTQAVRVD